VTQPPPGWYDAPSLGTASGKRGMPWWGWLTIGGVAFALLAAAGVGIVVWALRMDDAPVAHAREAVAIYDDAWVNADCAALERATTDAMRADWGYDECEQFVADARAFDEANRGYSTTFREATFASGVVTVETLESYTDTNGKRYTDRVTYTVVNDGGAWRIDAVHFANSQGAIEHA